MQVLPHGCCMDLLKGWAQVSCLGSDPVGKPTLALGLWLIVQPQPHPRGPTLQESAGQSTSKPRT